MPSKKSYTFKGKVWKYTAETGAWFFVYADGKTSAEIKKAAGKRRGFGSVRGKVTIGKTTWQTSLFPSKEGKYLLPIKVSVRKAEGIFEGDMVRVSFAIL